MFRRSMGRLSSRNLALLCTSILILLIGSIIFSKISSFHENTIAMNATTSPTQINSSTSSPSVNHPTPLSATTDSSTDTCRVALTFDDGPDLKQTTEILKILDQHKVPATFFMLGNMVEALSKALTNGSALQMQQAQYIVQQIQAAGHELGNHSWTHANFHKKSSQDIMNAEILPTSSAIKAIFGKEPQFFRPPYGNLKPDTADSVLQTTGMPTILWHIDTNDWKKSSKSEDRMLQAVTNGVASAASSKASQVKDAVILMHDGGGDRSKTIKSLPRIIDIARKNGCQIVPMSKIQNHPTLPPLKKQ